MFLQRLITAIILIPLVLGLLFYGNVWVLSTAIVAIFLACSWEWNKLIPLENMKYKLFYLTVSMLALWACGQIYDYWQYLGFVFWLGIVMAELTYPESMKVWGYKPVVFFTGLVLVPLFIHGLMKVYTLNEGKALLLYLFILIWSADSGAYLVGKQWGKHKMIPKVSPGKSWEGVLGGVLLAMMVAMAGVYWFKPVHVGSWMGLAFVIVIISIFGDLFISILKRRCGLKDTGALLPGHGGILDRLDSLIAAMPFYYFGLNSFGF